MTVILDKIIILILCLATLIFIPINLVTVICVLVAITVSSLCYFFQSNKAAALILGLYLCLCIVNPMFSIFLPLIAYDIVLYKLKYIGMVGVIALLLILQLNQLDVFLFCLLFTIIAIKIEYRTQKYDILLNDYKRLRDTSAELNMYLSNKNKMLMENQDYEIHLAMLKERNRIAREIHDNVGHMISRSLLQVGALLTICKEEVISNNLTLLKETLNDAMNNIRDSVHDLHDESIDLHSSINSIIHKFPDYKFTLDYDMSNHVSKNIKYCLISIIKEAFSNTAKHSNADSIDIIVREHPVFYQLLIKDNGTNCKAEVAYDGMGLENMRTRVANLSGNISIDESDGFKIFISIPKKDVEEENENL